MPIPKKKKIALQKSYEKEISNLLANLEYEEDEENEKSLDDDLDFDCEHYNRIETYDD